MTRHDALPVVPRSGRPYVSNLLVAGFFLAIFLACFASVLLSDYGYWGDYSRLVEGPQGWQVKRSYLEGRPINALIASLALQWMTDVEHLRPARLVAVLSIALLAYCVFRTLTVAGWSPFQSLCVAVIMGTALPFQVWMPYVECALFPFAALAAGLAFVLGERAFESRRRRSRWLLAAVAVLALLVALAIYQPAAMFFWVFAAVALLKPDDDLRDTFRRFGWYCAIALAGMCAGYVVYVLGPVWAPDSGMPYKQFGLVRDLPAKAVWFLFAYLTDAVNFVTPSPSYWLFPEAGGELSIRLYRGISGGLRAMNIVLHPFQALALAPTGALSLVHKVADLVIAWGVFAFIGGGLWLYFRGARRKRLWKCGIAVSLLFLTSIPVLVVEAKHSGYRTMPALASVIVLCAYFAFQGYTGRAGRLVSPACAHAVLGVAAVACVLSAAWHVHTFFTVPQVRELALMRSELAQADLSRIRSIRVILPALRRQYPSVPFIWREFGTTPSTLHFKGHVRSMVTLLLRELAPEHVGLPVIVRESAGFNGPPHTKREDILFLDFRKMTF